MCFSILCFNFLLQKSTIIVGPLTGIGIPMMCYGSIVPKQKVCERLGVELQAAISVCDAVIGIQRRMDCTPFNL